MSRPGRSGSLWSRVYRTLLRLLPADLRREAGPAMDETFERRLRARRERGRVAGFVVSECADLLMTAWRARTGSARTSTESGGDGTMKTMTSELRVAVRTLLRRPAFLLLASLTLALGLGANAAMLSVVNAVVLRPLDYPEADRLTMVFQTMPEYGFERAPLSVPGFLALREEADVFSSVGAAAGMEAVLLDRGDPQRIVGWRVSGDFFRTLGVDAVLGRTLGPEDERPGAPPVIVLTHALWTRSFGASDEVIGSTVRFDDGRYTVVGVMPPDLPGLGNEAFWLPLTIDRAAADPDMNFLTVIARRTDGIDEAAAAAEADRILTRVAAEVRPDGGRRGNLVSRHEFVVGGVRDQLLLLSVAAGLVLLVACANVAGLTLTRGTRRRRELALRSALGADRSGLIRHSLAESLVVAVTGVALGGALGWLLLRGFERWGPTDLPRDVDPALGAPALLALGLLGAGCLALFGLLPALRAASTAPGAGIRSGGTRAGASTRPQAVLAATQVALATLLLVGATLLGRSLLRLQAVDPGFDSSGVLTAMVPFPAETPDARVAFVADLDRRIAAIPGVTASGVTWSLPFADGEASTRAMREDETLPADERMQVWTTPVTPGFFEAMGMPLLAGRGFAGSPGPDDPPVAVVNEALAEALWPGENPVGKRFLRGGGDDPTAVEVVGLVPDTRTTSLAEEEVYPYVYAPFSQTGWAGRGYLVLRSTGDPLELVAPLRAAVAEVASETPLDPVTTLDGLVGATLARPRFRAALVSAFAALGAVLALVGVYGVMSLLVASRRREIGVRMALGAAHARVRREVVGRALGIAGLGLVAGVAGAWALSRTLEGFLFGVSGADPATYVGVGLAVLLGVLAAVAPTARRAAAVDPVEVLQGD